MRQSQSHVFLKAAVASLFIFAIATGLSAQVCGNDDDCSGDDACIAGWCVAPVPDPVIYATNAALREASYWREFQFPALFDPAELCCFDYDGDSTADDAWGNLLAAFGSLLEIDYQDEIDAQVAAGELLRTTDWVDLPIGLVDGLAHFSVFDAIPAPGSTVPDLAAGTGNVLLEAASFGSHGAIDQFNTATLTGAVLDGSGNSFAITLLLTAETPLHLSLRQPRVEFPLSEDGARPGICTVDEIRPGATPEEVGGGKLGGLIHLDDYLSEMDRVYRQCTCAGVDPSQPVIVWSPNTSSGRFDVACTDPGSWDTTPCVGFCESLDYFCGFSVTMIPSTADIDSDDDTVIDSWSVGLRVSLVGTAIVGTDLIFRDGFESGDMDGWTTWVD